MQNLKTVWLILFVMFMTTGLSAGPEGVIKTIPTGQYPGGLTWDGEYLWLGYLSSSQLLTIDKIDTADGSVIRSIQEPKPEAAAEIRGLAWDGSYLWVYRYRFGTAQDRWDYIYKMDTTGAVLDSIRSPFEDYCGGLAFGDSSLFVSQYYSSNASFDNVIHEIDTSSGAIIQTFASVGEQPMGVAWDGQYVLCAEDTGFGATRQEIYQYDPVTGLPTGVVLRNPDESPRDMTFDGKDIWLVGYYTRLIYKISIAGGTPGIDVPVTSLNFGLVSVGDTASLTLNISNTGDAVLEISSIDFDTSVYFVDVASYPLLIEAGQSLALDVYFAPAAQGTVPGLMSIHNNDPLDPVVDVNLNGQGQFSEPTIWLSDTAHDFGNVWIPVEGKAKWTLRIANTGNQDLEIVDLILDEPAFSVGGFTTFPITIAPNDTFPLPVFFQPSDTTVYQDSLIVASTDLSSPFVYVNLTGTGILDDYTTGYAFWNYTVPDNPSGSSYQEYEVDGMEVINDINGDGVSEVVIATENYWILCLDGNSSGTADTLWSFSTYISSYSAGSIGANSDYGVQDAIEVASDLNGDGFNDIVIATGGGNEHVYAIDGTSGDMLWTFGTDDPNSYGLGDFQAVDVQRDFNQDGIPDVLAIADGNQEGTGYKSAYLFDGSNGTMIWNYPYPGPNPSFGKTIISVDDINGDNLPDAVIAVSNNTTSDLKTYALDGATGFVIWDRDAVNYGPKEMFELPVAGETPDVIVGEYFRTVQRLDGETGIPLWTRDFGGLSGIIEMDRITDINDDGIDDILIASFTSGANLLSGADGNTIWTHPMEYQFAIQSIPDIDGDGYEDVLVGTGNSSPTFGNFYAISGKKDSVLFNQYFATDKVYSVHAMESIDGNASSEMVIGTREGLVFCYSGGVDVITTLDGDKKSLPGSYQLAQNYPNPFNPVTTIAFTLPTTATVNLRVYNVLGQLVAMPVEQRSFEAGTHQLQFNASKLTSGMYIYQLESDLGILYRRMILLK